MFRLPVSHRVPQHLPDPKRSFKDRDVQVLEAIGSWAERFFGNTWFPPRWPVHLHEIPKEGIIRAVAYDAVRRYRKATPQIPLFDRVLRVYCGIVMGHTDRYVVSEYVLRRLRNQVAEYRRTRWCLKKPMTRHDLEGAATLILSDVERAILQMATSGRVLKHDHPRGYQYVCAQTAEGSRKCFITLGKPDRSHGWERPILCLQTPALFDRGKNRRFRRQRDDYRNCHPMFRH